MSRTGRTGLARAARRIASECVCSNLRKTSRAVTQAFDEVLRPSGIRATQIPVLVALTLHDHLPMSALGRALGMDRTTLTRNLQPLIAAGYVSVVAGEDRRQRMVELSAAGARALETAVPLWQRAQADVLRRIGAAHWSKLLPELHALSRAGCEE